MRLLQKALTFDDVLLVPAYSNVLPRETVLSTQFTRDLRLNIPFCSAAMDTVTEANLAIALAQEGGIGIIHKNMTAQAQAAEVNKVKRHEAGMGCRPDHHRSGHDCCRRDSSDPRTQHFPVFPLFRAKKFLVWLHTATFASKTA